MSKIKINTINSDSNAYLNNEITELVKKMIPVDCNPIYVELWCENEFRQYFTKACEILQQPIGPDKLPEGIHDYVNENNQLLHKIAIILNENWRITLKHELVHVICAELVGIEIWTQIRDIFKDSKRKRDPFEYIAIFLSNPEIIYELKGEIELK